MLVVAAFLQVLLAATAFTLPTSRERYEARVARRASGLRQSVPKKSNSSHVTLSSNWAGAVWISNPPGTFQEVSGGFTVPTIKEPDGQSGPHSASIWVGIDGASCTSAIFQTGVDITINNGVISYDAWYEWFPDISHDFQNIVFAPGDAVTLTVVASSPTSGTAFISNLSKGFHVSQTVNSTAALCETDAEWVIEDLQTGNGPAPFANFGTVKITDTFAKTTTGTVTAAGSTVVDIEQNGAILTSVSISGSTVTISYL